MPARRISSSHRPVPDGDAAAEDQLGVHAARAVDAAGVGVDLRGSDRSARRAASPAPTAAALRHS